MKKLFIIMTLFLTQNVFSQVLPDKTVKIIDLYQLSAQQFQSGDKDKAVTFYYAGQIRLRVLARLDNDETATPALLGSLQEQLGRPVNQYAGSNINKWISSIKEAMKWSDKQEFPELQEMLNASHKTAEDGLEARKKVNEGLLKLIIKIESDRDNFYKKRIENGLPVNDPEWKK